MPEPASTAAPPVRVGRRPKPSRHRRKRAVSITLSNVAIDIIRSMKNLLGGEDEPVGPENPPTSAIPVSETSSKVDAYAQYKTGSMPAISLTSNFRCPERGEEFEVYVRTLERDFKAYDPDFVIERWLGSGGFCDVFFVPEVKIPGKGRRRAVLRVLRPTKYRTTDPELNNQNIRLFLTEMGYNLYLSSQNVPNIVKMYDFGFFGRAPGQGRGGEGPRHLYMIMEHVDGEDVSVRWRKKPSDEKELMKRVVLVNLIAGIVGDLHFRGIIHCDIKPTNVLIRGNSPYLTDFGSARWMHVKDDVGGMHMIMPGTQTYMSYEQLQGDIYRLDQRTDIFSLAVLACYAFTGTNPFQARTDIDIKNEPLGLAALSMVDPEVPKIPYRSGDKLREILLECLSRDPEQRPSSMVAFQHRLNSWILES